MLRKTLLYLSNQQRVFAFVRKNRLAKRMASRFVAGETIDEAMMAVRALNARGIPVSLDLLGESVHREEEARGTTRAYLELLDRIKAEKLDANRSSGLSGMFLMCIKLSSYDVRGSRSSIRLSRAETPTGAGFLFIIGRTNRASARQRLSPEWKNPLCL